jgi:hypothetical protein
MRASRSTSAYSCTGRPPHSLSTAARTSAGMRSGWFVYRVMIARSTRLFSLPLIVVSLLRKSPSSEGPQGIGAKKKAFRVGALVGGRGRPVVPSRLVST